MKELFTIQPGENLVLKFRKHWFVLLQSCLPTLVVGVLPFALFPFVAAWGLLPQILATPALIMFASAWWLIVGWLALCALWTNYYLDIWIVTDRRIVNVNQISLFDREITVWRLDRVQKVIVHVHNVIETLLKFGSLEVQTAGPIDEFAMIHGVDDPEYVQRVIMAEVDHFDPAHLPR